MGIWGLEMQMSDDGLFVHFQHGEHAVTLPAMNVDQVVVEATQGTKAKQVAEGLLVHIVQWLPRVNTPDDSRMVLDLAQAYEVLRR